MVKALINYYQTTLTRKKHFLFENSLCVLVFPPRENTVALACFLEAALTGIHDDQWVSVRTHSRLTYMDWERDADLPQHHRKPQGSFSLCAVSSEHLYQVDALGSLMYLCTNRLELSFISSLFTANYFALLLTLWKDLRGNILAHCQA